MSVLRRWFGHAGRAWLVVGLLVVLASNALMIRLAMSYQDDIATSCHAIKSFIGSDANLRERDDRWRPPDEVQLDNAYVSRWKHYAQGITC